MKARYYIYWNLHKKMWSVRHKGKVIAHSREIHARDCEFKVSEAGRQRVLREKRKNVHAYVVCKEYECPYWLLDYDNTARYTPYKYPQFYDKYGHDLFKAPFVNLHKDGTVSYAYK